MNYTCSVPFHGDTTKAFDLGAAALTSLGFQMVTRDASSVELLGPGMNSTRQSSLLGASRIQILRTGSQLQLDAELGGVLRMTRFVALFPVGLSLFLGILFFVVFSLVFEHRGWIIPVVAVTVGNAVLWMFLAPVLARYIHTRTCRGIDTLLNNMAVAGEARA